MAEHAPSPSAPSSLSSDDRLDSWKEIATYLKRDVTTVQRWEKREGMPVHRHVHGRLGSVHAYRWELDAWSKGRTLSGAADQTVTGPDADVSLHRSHWRPVAGIAVAIAATLIALSFWTLRPPASPDNPLATARFRALTDFETNEFAASISRDGRFVAFLSNRDGATDAWVTGVGTGRFQNLTRGRLAELVNPSVRTLQFAPDASFVSVWVRRPGGGSDDIGLWSVPTWSAEPQPFLEGIAEVDWSHDGSRLVYHTPGPGDPTFVRTMADGVDRPIFTAAAGLHAHFPTWSPDDRFVYFVQGSVPDAMDVWRIPAAGGAPERLTFHNARVTHPAFIDANTLAYLSTEQDGSGPWLYGLDLATKTSRRLSVGSEQYTSLAASADGRTLVATVARPRGTLWRVALMDRTATDSDMQRVAVASGTAMSPRVGPGFLLFVSSRDGSDTIAQLAGSETREIWTAPGARVSGAPAVAPDGRRVAFTAAFGGESRLYVMNVDGSDVRTIAFRAPRGAPAWSPDGRSLVVAGAIDGVPRLSRIDVASGTIVMVGPEHALDPEWSPDGAVIISSGADVGTTFPVQATDADGMATRPVDVTLTRGARRLRFLPGSRALVMLRGQIAHKNFWVHDLATGEERQLTDFGPEVAIRDFDISPDGREIVFDQVQENADLVLIDLAGAR